MRASVWHSGPRHAPVGSIFHKNVIDVAVVVDAAGLRVGL